MAKNGSSHMRSFIVIDSGPLVAVEISKTKTQILRLLLVGVAIEEGPVEG